jgi:RHS repeat-associated protein
MVFSGIVGVSAGRFHALALKTDGTVWAWGGNDSGQLGLGSTIDSPTPLPISGLSNIVAVSAGGAHSLALDASGNVWAWGSNIDGQLGDGTNNNQPVPKQVLTGVSSIGAGGLHSLAVKATYVWSWGKNDHGQLALGTGNDVLSPTQTAIGGVIQVSAGLSHSVALKSDHTVRTWGFNSNGQLGNNSILDSSSPVTPAGLPAISQVSGGAYHSVAAGFNGTMYAWGLNAQGQLGNMGTLDQHSPVGTSSWVGPLVSAGGFHTSSLVEPAGYITDSGDNGNGQLGDGSIVNQTTMTPVQNFTAPAPSGVPTNVVATARDSSASLTWSAPGTDNGSAVRQYVVTAYINGVAQQPVATGSASVPTSQSPFLYSPLQNGVTYTFNVAAQSCAGTSAGAASSAVTPHPAPTLGKVADRSQYSRGDLATYTLTAANPGTSNINVSLEDDLSAGLAASAQMPIQASQNGGSTYSTCNTTTVPKCTVIAPGQPGQKIQVTNAAGSFISLAPGASLKVKYTVVALGSDRACSLVQNTAFTNTDFGDHITASAPVTVCQSGLGYESWWTYVQRAIGPQGQASANVSNGNLVLQQTDSQPVQAHGRLSYVMRRTYNSQANTAAALPGSIGEGWILNVGQADDLAGLGATADGLYVPSATDLVMEAANPLGVTYVDRDGTRHVFQPRLIPAVSVSGLAGPQLILRPAVLPSAAPDTGYDSVQVDQVFDPPPGVHLGLWRYVEVCTNPAGCGSTPTGQKKVIGYGAERTDRIRYEFAADGRLLDMQDGSGVELRYGYETAPVLPANVVSVAPGRLLQVYEPRTCTPPLRTDASSVPSAATCRRMDLTYSTDNKTITAWDPSGEVTPSDSSGHPTIYHLDCGQSTCPIGGVSPVSHLVSVDNPDGSHLSYTYGGCGGTADQMCSSTDPRNTPTRFQYTTNQIGGALPEISQISDRRGTATNLTYASDGLSTTADVSGERQLFSSIDTTGRVGQVDEGDTSGSHAYLHTTQFTWDTGAASCRQPSPAVDNNLCRVVRFYSPGSPSAAAVATPGRDQDSLYLYNQEGALLVQRQNGGTGSPAPGASCSTCIDTTFGYHIQYVQASGASQTVDDSVNGSGYFCTTASTPCSGPTFATRPTGATNLFPIVDRTQQLSPRGNDPSVATDYPCSASTTWKCFLTTYQVEDNAGAQPNAIPGATTCSAPGNPTYNTGATCESDTPLDGAVDGSGNPRHAVTQYTYDTFGQKFTRKTPKAIDEGLSGQYQYAYYSDGETDLSGNLTSGGWLKATTDPTGAFVFFGYDRAGNVVRTWDRNATGAQGTSVGTFNTSGGGFAETVHGTSYSLPWRYVTAKSDPLSNRSTYTVDANGNQTRLRSPRGNAANNASFDVTQGFDLNDNPICQVTPAEAAGATCASDVSGQTTPAQPAHASTNQFDAWNDKTQSTDPNGHVITSSFDAVNRTASTQFTRGAWDPNNIPTGCAQVGSNASCSTSSRYDGTDNVVSSTDANQHQTTFIYDAFHRRISQTVPRNDGALSGLTTGVTFDQDGHVVLVTPPRGSSEGPAAAFQQASFYDPAGRLTSKTVPRTASQTDTASYGYDADGNQTRMTDPNTHATISGFDILDRKTTTTTPRDASTGETTAYTYDPVGNQTSATKPGNLITAYSFDADNRVVDTVEGADSTTALNNPATDAVGGRNVRHRQFHDADGHLVGVLDPRAFASCTNPGQPCAPTPSTSPYVARTDYDVDGRPTLQWVPYADSSAAAIPGGLNDPGQCPIPSGPGTPATAGGAPGYPNTTRVCVTQAKYDSAGNRSQVILPTSATPAANPPVSPSDNRYVSYTYTYDNLLAVVDAPSPDTSVSRATSFSYYNGDGKLLTAVDALGHRTTTTYYDDNTVRQSSDTNGPVSHTTTYCYDADGNPIAQFDGKASNPVCGAGASVPFQKTTYFNDDLRKDVTDGAGDKTSYSYDADGKPLSVTSPSANTADATNPAGTPTTYSYTYDELLLSENDPVAGNGSQLRRTTYHYDPAARKDCQRVDLVAPAASALTCYQGQVDPAVSNFYFYNDGRLQQESGRFNSGALVYTYDAAGNTTQVADHESTTTSIDSTFYLNDLPSSVADGTRTTSYSYNGAGSRSGMVETGGSTSPNESFAYGDAGLPLSMTSTVAGGGTTSFGYDKVGAPASESDPNGAALAYSFYGDGTLNQLTVRGSGGANLATWSYGYDQNYQITSQAFSGQAAAAGGGGLVTDSLAYVYDAAHRVSSFQQGTAPAKTVSYDHNSNRTAYGANLSWTYRADNSINSATDSGAVASNTLTYSYYGFGGVQSDGCTNYTYDGFDRTSTATGQTVASRCAAPSTVSYAYDALDRQSSSTLTGSGTTSLHYDGTSQAVLVETPPAAGALTYEVTPRGAHKALTQAGTGGVTQYLQDDGHGNVTTVTNSSTSTAATAVACSARFDPYGTPLQATIAPPPSPGSTPPVCDTGASAATGTSVDTANTVFYGGGRRDSTTQDYQFGSRTYDPSKAAFLTPDSYRAGGPDANLGVGTDPLTANRYSYVNGDPVNLVDPTGHKACEYDTGPCGHWSYKGGTGCEGCSGAVQAYQYELKKEKYQQQSCGGGWDVQRRSLHGMSTCGALEDARARGETCRLYEDASQAAACRKAAIGGVKSALTFDPFDCLAAVNQYCQSELNRANKYGPSPLKMGVTSAGISVLMLGVAALAPEVEAPGVGAGGLRLAQMGQTAENQIGAEAPVVSAPVQKFSDYVFKVGDPSGKGAIFKSLGYSAADSEDLAQTYESQAAQKIASGDFTLGRFLPEYGQNINVVIQLNGKELVSGWMIRPTDEGITLNTPFAGFAN